MKLLLKFKKLIGLIILIFLIIYLFYSNERDTKTTISFMIGFVISSIFLKSQDSSNSFLIYLFEKYEKQIDMNEKEFKVLRRELNRMNDDNFMYRQQIQSYEKQLLDLIKKESTDGKSDLTIKSE